MLGDELVAVQRVEAQTRPSMYGKSSTEAAPDRDREADTAHFLWLEAPTAFSMRLNAFPSAAAAYAYGWANNALLGHVFRTTLLWTENGYPQDASDTINDSAKTLQSRAEETEKSSEYVLPVPKERYMVEHMFEGWAGRLHQAVADGCASDLTMASVDELRELLVSVQSGIDRLQALHARVGAEFEAREGHRADGCSSMASWLRRHLRMSATETRARRRAAAALVELPAVKAAVDAGEIRPAHLDVFATGIKRLGGPIMRDHLDLLLPVARDCDPADLLTAVDRLRDTIDPDAADRDWIQAQERYDVTVRRVGHGFDVSGYLDVETGTKLKHVLNSIAAPAGSDDQRPVAQRRVEGLSALLTSILEAGLPSDKGVRPHLAVNVDLETLKYAIRGDHQSSAPPAVLAGYGPIGRDLLSRLACDTALSVVLTKTADGAGRYPYKHVLDVGRTERLATAKQRLAILIQQDFRCANSGCTNTYLEIHHIISWLDGGPTDMDNLCGLCIGCHHLVHAGLLICSKNPDSTLVFHTRDGTTVPDRRQRALTEFHRRLDPPRPHRKAS